MTSVFFRPYEDLLSAYDGDEGAVMAKLTQVADEAIMPSQQLWQFRISQLREGKNSLWSKGKPTPLARAMAGLWSRAADELFANCYENNPDAFTLYWQDQPFVREAKHATKPRKNPNVQDLQNPTLSTKERLAILLEHYPEAPEKLLEAIAKHGDYPRAFARLLQTVDPCKAMKLSAINALMHQILIGELSGWDYNKQPNAIIRGAANLTGWPLDDFVPVLSDDERLNDWREKYSTAPDALLQVMVPFKTVTSFAKVLRGVEPLKSAQATMDNVRIRLLNILIGRYDSDLAKVKEPDGTRKPNTIIQAVAEFTGLDVRYFLRRQDGGIALKRGERIVYDEASQTFAIVNTTRTAQALRTFDAAL